MSLRPVGDLDDAADRFRSLYDAHAADVLSYLLRRSTDPDAAADALADTFLVVWRRIDDVPAGPDARPWLFGVARLTHRNVRRGRRRRDRLADRLRDDLRTRPQTWTPADGRAEEIIGALSRLREPDRELLTLVGWDGLTPAQAASVLDIPAGTARVRLHRARTRLRELLGEETTTDRKRPPVARTGDALTGDPARPGREEL